MNQYDQRQVVSETTPALSIFKNSPLRLEIPSGAMSVVNSSPVSDYFSPSSADGNESNIDHITSLERSLCSNFFCCGSQLPDLHALLDHFEEDHIMVLAPNGKRVYPRDGLRSVPLHTVQSALATPSPSSSRSSSVAPSSSSSTPSTPSDFSSPTSGPFASRKSNLTAVTPVYTPFTPSLPVDPADPYPDTNEIIMEQDPRIYGLLDENFPTVLAAPFESMTPPSSSDEDEEMSDCCALDTPGLLPPLVYTGQIKPISAPMKHVKFAAITPRGRPPSKSLENLSTTPSSMLNSKSKSKNRHSPTGPVLSSRRREKSYRCPTPRCTKTYLNPNGLKYHMEKGTCKIEGESESEAGESSTSTPHSPSSSVLLPYGGSSSTSAPSSSSNPYPHIQPHLGPIQDVEMRTDTTASDAPGTPKTDVNVDNDADPDVVINEATETTAATGSSSSPSILKSELDQNSNCVSQVQQQEQEEEQACPIPGTYYRHRPSADICPASTGSPSISLSSAASPKVNNKGGDEQQNDPSRRTQDIEPQSRKATSASASAASSGGVASSPRLAQLQQIYHYPVPSYPQLSGPNALLAGYTTFIHRPYYAAAPDRTSSAVSATPVDHAHIYSPIPVMSALNSARLQ